MSDPPASTLGAAVSRGTLLALLPGFQVQVDRVGHLLESWGTPASVCARRVAEAQSLAVLMPLAPELGSVLARAIDAGIPGSVEVTRNGAACCEVRVAPAGPGAALVVLREAEPVAAGSRRESAACYEAMLATTTDGFWLSDEAGLLLDVNQAYCRISGYSRDELLRMRVADLEAAESPQEIAAHIRKLAERGWDRFDSRHRTRDGRIVDVEISSTWLPASRRVVVFVRDLTARRRDEARHRRNEARLAFTLDLGRRLSTLSEKEILDLAVEQAARLTDSRIAYLHTVNEDQCALTLVTWNRQALEGCTAVTETHYPLDAAGVWADCVRQRRPVIHNDFASLPERRGYPEGHSPVTRHLSVPIFDGDKIRMVIGVGNSEAPYQSDAADTLTALGADLLQVVMRQRAEQALRESEQRFRLIAEHAQDLVYRYRLHPDPGFEYVSPSATAMTGYTPEEHYADPELGQRLVHPEDRELLQRMASDPDSSPELLLRWVRRDGTVLWTEQRNVAVRDRSGQVVAIEGIARDVTRRLETEEALRDSEERFRQFAEHSQDVLWITDLGPERISFVSPAYERIWARPASSLYADPQGWLAAIHPDDREAVAAGFTAAVAGAVPSFAAEYRVVRPDGEIRWVADWATVIRDASGVAHRLAGVARDVTERHAAEDALRESEERHRSVIAALGEGVVLQTADGAIRASNASAERILGLSADQLAGRTSMDPRWRSVHPDGRPFPGEEHPAMVTLRTGQACSDVAMGVHRPDGSLTWISINSQPLTSPGAPLPHAVVVSFTDITARRQAEEALRRSEDAYRRLVELSPDGIVVYREGRIVFANPAAVSLLGVDSTTALLGRRFADFVVPGETSQVAEHKRLVLERGQAVPWHEHHLVRAGGDLADVEVASIPFAHEGQPAVKLVIHDTTARKQAQAALVRSEARFRAIIDVSPVPMALNDAQQRIVFLNPAFVKTFGYTMEDIPTLSDWWPAAYPDPEYRQRVVAAWQAELERVNRTGAIFSSQELTVRCKNGSNKTMLASAAPFNSSFDGEHLVVLYDITERKQIEQELRANQAWLAGQRQMLELIARGEALPIALRRLVEILRTLLPEALASVLVLDRDGVTLRLGAAPELSEEFRRALDGCRVDQDSGSGGRAAALGTAVIVADIATSPLCGPFRSHALAAGLRACWSFPLLTGRGDVVGVLGLYCRISREPGPEERRFIEGVAQIAALAIERARTERAIRAAAEDWVATFDAMESAVLVLDDTDRIAQTNGAAVVLLGGDAASWHGRALAGAGDGEPWLALRSAVVEARAGHHVELSRVRDAQCRCWEVDATLAAGDPAGSGRVIATLRDVSRLADLQESIVRAERMAAMGSLVAGVAHEVRNPLFAMSVNIDALEVVLKDRMEVRDLVDALREERDRISALMEDLLSFGRPHPSLRVAGPIEPVLAASLRSCAATAARFGVRLERRGSAAVVEMMIDAGRIEEVFDNLLENACQHSLPGGEVVLSTELVSDPRGARLRIRITDQGTGFSSEALVRAFEPFYTRRKGGTGLGLAIVQRIVDEHQGSVAVENLRDGHGALVTVELPVVQASQA